MTKQNHNCTKKSKSLDSHLLGCDTLSLAREVSLKGSRFIFTGKAVQEEHQMWRHNPRVHRRKNFNFRLHKWSSRSDEHGTRVQCPYGWADRCRLPITASVLLNIVLITLRKCNRPSYTRSSWLLLNRFRRIFQKGERERYAHFQSLLFLMDVVNWLLLRNRSLKLQYCALLVHFLIRRPG